MLVAMVEIGDVWVSMHERLVPVPMAVADVLRREMVLVMDVVFMLMRVLHRLMGVFVLVA